MNTRSGRPPSQDERELSSFIALLQREGVGRYLEVGARDGDTFYKVMMSLPEGSFGVAVDLPGGPWGRNSRADLKAAVAALEGRSGVAIFGDSTKPDIIKSVMDYGPFDAALIDGDHRYEGVKADWENYPARIVAFHDIAGDGVMKGSMAVEVPRLWREIKAEYEHVEFISPGSRMGIGAAWLSR